MFRSLKFIKPLWYFHLRHDKNLIWPDSNYVTPKPFLDNRYETVQAMFSEASYVALMNGSVLANSQKVYLPKEIVNFEHSPNDEFRFIRKFFNPMWSVGYLVYRIVTLKSIYKSIVAFMNTFFLKRIKISYTFRETKLKLNESKILFEDKKKVRIIIPTYNRYSVLYSLLKDLEGQTYTNFSVTVIDQSENFNRNFYTDFGIQIDLIRQEKPGLWKARNNAIKNTHEEVIALLDDDSRIEKDWILKHLNCLNYFSAEISAGVSLSKKGAKTPFNYRFYRDSDQLDTGNVVIYRRVFRICGLFDEQYEGMRMGDAEFGLRAFQKGVVSISNPEAYRVHLKTSKGGLRDLGSWDAFRQINFLKPRPIPSVLYYARKNFGDYNALIFLIINLPLSFSTYSKKTDSIHLVVSLLIFTLFFPLIVVQTFISWKISSSILSEGHKIPYEQ